MLSNTATPKYYGAFRDAVLRGNILVNEEISLQMNLIDGLITNPNFYYDDEPVEHFIDFCENELTLTDGEDLHLLDTFKLWAEDVLCWFYFEEREVFVPYPDGRGGRTVLKRVKRRLRQEQYLIVGRGAAKSLYDSCMQCHFLVNDPHTTSQITTAPTMRQADEILSPIRTAIVRSRGPQFKFMTDGSIQNTTGKASTKVKLVSTKKGIENKLTNSLIEIKPLSIDKLQGLRCKIATLDEWLSGDLRESPITAIAQGAAKIFNYLIIATSSEGTVRNGAGDSVKMELQDILHGKYVNTHKSIWYYKLDDISEVADPTKWIKANPNLGKTVSYDTYQQEVEKAEHNPADRNDIIAKRFGIPMEGFTYFFTYAETQLHPKRSYWRMPCALGADLSRGDDFCAFTFLFPLPRGGFGVKTRDYITGLTLRRLPRAMREKYNRFIQEGSLIIFEEDTVLNMMKVYDDLDDFITRNEYDVRTFGYDPYNAQAFVERWCTEYGQYGVEKVIQGARTESVPLGELKTMAHERLLFFDEELMMFTMENAMVIEDTNGNRKLMKKRNDQKIDAVAAMMDAYVSYKAFPDAFE